MNKIDWKRELKHLYKPKATEVSAVMVPPLRYLMIDGQGDPNESREYAEAVQALFSVSYKAKFVVKRSQAKDYVVMPLEGLWWADDHAVFSTNDRKNWQWTMMIMQPEIASDEVLAMAIEDVRETKGLPGLDRIRLETFDEGLCAQTLHIGPFSEEGPTIQRVHEFIEQRSGLWGKHHEIYLSDIRRANPANWKTVIRQPMDDV